MSYHQLLTATEFTSFVSRFEAPPGWDYETNGKEHSDHDGRIVGISMAAPIENKAVAAYIPVAHQRGTNASPLILHAVAEYLTNAPIVPYSLSTEYAWSAVRLHVKPRIVGDGFVAARLLQLEDKSLKELSKSVLGREEVITLKSLFPPNEANFDFSQLDPQDGTVARYVEDDALNAFDLEGALRSRLSALGMLGVYDLELTAGMMMAEAELRGVYMSTGEFLRAVAKERARVEQLERQIFGLLGGKAFSLNSPTQLGKALKLLGITPRLTPLGNESWSIESLKLIPNPPEVVEKVIEWKSAFSVMNGLGKNQLRADDSGRIWPRWMALGYSGDPGIRSDKPSLTTLPKIARTAFVAPPGHRWFMWAWLQPKMRALAYLSKDVSMKALFSTTFDFYTTVGATLRGAQAGDGTEADRAWAKRALFAMVDYCGNTERVAARLGITSVQADETVGRLTYLFPEMSAYLDDMRLRYADPMPLADVTSYMGRRWVLSGDREYGPAAAISAQLGHTVATWLKIAMCRVMAQAELEHPRLRGYSQWLPVYDRVYYVLPEDQHVGAHLAYMRSMVEPLYDGVPLRAEYGVGPSWGTVQVINELAFAQAMADLAAGSTE